MQLLQELLEIRDNYYKVYGFDLIEEKMQEMKAVLQTIINEGFVDDHRGDLEREFDELEKKYIAARRALGTINRGGKHLSQQDASEHRSKIMKYLNMFRNRLQNTMMELNMSNREIEYHMNRMDHERKDGRPSEVFSHTKRDERPVQRERTPFRKPLSRNVA